MDQRHLIKIPFIFLLSMSASAETITLEPPAYVEASPLDAFSERADGWTFSERESKQNHAEQQQLYDELAHVPGIAAAQETPRLSIRGSSSLARILGLYDGIPLNLADGFGFSPLLMPQEAASSVRIIKGPASVFWGKDAMGGAINVIPKTFDRPLARLHVGSFGQRGGFAAIPIISPTEKSNLQVTAYGDKTDGNFPYQSTTSGMSGTRESNDRATQRFTLKGEHDFGGVSVKKNLVWAQEFASTPGSINFPGTTHFNRTAGLASIGVESKVVDGWRGAYRLSGLLNDNAYESAFPLSTSKATRVSNSASVKKIFSDGISLEVFADHFHDELDGSFVQNNHYLSNETETGALLAFPFQPNWMIRPGFRYIWAYQKFIPALGFFEQDEGFSRWLTYSHGFRVPSLAQRFANAPDFVADPNLKPESSEQIELGFQQKTTPEASRPWAYYEYGVSVFSSQYKEFLDTVPTAVANQYTSVNRGNAQADGVEGRAGYNQDNWGLRGEISYLKTEDNLKKPLPLSPEVQTLVNAHLGWAMLVFELEHTLWSKYHESAGKERVGWNTLDFHISTAALNKWDFKASLFNLADSPRETVTGYPEAGRRLWVSAGRSF
ncbi:MAG: TonB-dependent receptor [Bdellovibrionia bacterium]